MSLLFSNFTLVLLYLLLSLNDLRWQDDSAKTNIQEMSSIWKGACRYFLKSELKKNFYFINTSFPGILWEKSQMAVIQ